MGRDDTSWTHLAERGVVVAEGVAIRDIDQETVLLNVATGRYHGIDRIGRRFLAAVSESPDPAAVVPVLAREFGQPREVIEADLLSFCRELLDAGLVELRPQT